MAVTSSFSRVGRDRSVGQNLSRKITLIDQKNTQTSNVSRGKEYVRTRLVDDYVDAFLGSTRPM
jgi:hypothetical protein